MAGRTDTLPRQGQLELLSAADRASPFEGDEPVIKPAASFGAAPMRFARQALLAQAVHSTADRSTR